MQKNKKGGWVLKIVQANQPEKRVRTIKLNQFQFKNKYKTNSINNRRVCSTLKNKYHKNIFIKHSKMMSSISHIPNHTNLRKYIKWYIFRFFLYKCIYWKSDRPNCFPKVSMFSNNFHWMYSLGIWEILNQVKQDLCHYGTCS